MVNSLFKKINFHVKVRRRIKINLRPMLIVTLQIMYLNLTSTVNLLVNIKFLFSDTLTSYGSKPLMLSILKS